MLLGLFADQAARALPAQARYIALALFIPTLTYVLPSWVWLLARILNDLSGGSPAATPFRMSPRGSRGFPCGLV
jgi:hypothetical protein